MVSLFRYEYSALVFQKQRVLKVEYFREQFPVFYSLGNKYIYEF